jgi:GMP synthase (glutamine-hydrolysing)
VETQLLPLSTSFDEIKALSHVKAIIISGGPQSVYASDAPKFDPKILDLGLPIFGICYGMQLLAYYTGNKVERKEQREDGQFAIHVCPHIIRKFQTFLRQLPNSPPANYPPNVLCCLQYISSTG